MRREHQPYVDPHEPQQKMSFADGLRAMNTRGIIVGPPVRMNKSIARAVEYLCDQMVYCVPEFETEEDEHAYHAGIAWIRQQIQKRYSTFDFAR